MNFLVNAGERQSKGGLGTVLMEKIFFFVIFFERFLKRRGKHLIKCYVLVDLVKLFTVTNFSIRSTFTQRLREMDFVLGIDCRADFIISLDDGE